jgi:APA family basic amino acid/polyamine antiporter
VTGRARLGFTAAFAIVVANMIGAGVFTSAGYQAISLHDGWTMLLTWIVGGVIALCGAAAYGELGAMMPRVGGEYVYLRRAYHPVVGVMSGWASLIAGFSAPIAAAAILFAAYSGKVFDVADPTAQKAIAVALIAAMTSLHAFDTVIGGRVQTAFTIGKIVLIVYFVARGLTSDAGDWSNLDPRAGGLDNVWTNDFAMALMYVAYAYSGWNAAAYIAGEIDRPERNLPRALLAGTGVVMLLYFLLNLIFLYAVPPETLGGPPPIHEVGDAAARVLLGDSHGQFVSTAIALALISSVSAMVMAGPRVYSSMAEDGALPRALARRTARGVPLVAVALQGALASLFVIVGELGQLLRYIGFTLSIFAMLTVAAVFVMRVKEPDAPRPYRTLGYPVTPIVFLVATGWVLYAQIDMHPWESLYGFLTLAIGGIGYLWIFSTESGTTGRRS